jgi:hypothetical protein
MKKGLLVVLALAALGLSAQAQGRVFALATAGDVDAGLAERVRAYYLEQTGAALRMTEPVAVGADQTLEQIGRAAAQALKADEVGVLVLARPALEQPQGVCLPHERFGILNLNRLGEGVDEDRLVRRAGQDGLRVLSMLLGMSPCPFPLCVLTGFEKTEDLDRMSGNYCPPCRDRFARLAAEAGIAVVEPTAVAGE